MKPIQRNAASAITEHEAKADPHTPYVKHSLATALNDFLIASGASVFVKKTLAEVKTILGLGSAAYTESSDYAVAAKGVTNGDSHDHVGGDGAQISHTGLSNIGTNTHAQIDTHISAVAPHSGIGDVHECRLNYLTTSSVRLSAFAGNKLFINGVIATPGANDCTSGTTLITATGADAGVTPSASSSYYVYFSNANATFAPSELRLSSTAFATTSDGRKYLGTGGNALNWRYVGMVYLNASIQFVDNAYTISVVSEFNRQKKILTRCPGYNNNNASTAYTHNSANFAVASVLASPQIEFLNNGMDDIRLHAKASYGTESVNLSHGIAIDSATSASAYGFSTGTFYGTDSIEYLLSSTVPGYHFANQVWATSSTKTILADGGRVGSVTDPYLTYLTVEVWI